MERSIPFITVLLLGLFFGCKKQSNKTDPIDIPKQEQPIAILDSATNEDYMIINSTLVHLVNPGPPDFELSFGYDNFDYKKRDIHISPDELDSLHFTPYLVTLRDSIKTRIEPLDLEEKEYEEIEDPMHKELVKKLFNDNLRATKINLERINNKGTYILKAVKPEDNPDLEMGEKIISFSKIIYNKDKTKATFYFENYCSGLCGVGQVILMEKIDGIWEIKDTITDWIS